MDIKRNVVVGKKERKAPTKQCTSLHPFTAHEVALSPAKIDFDGSQNRSAPFDPSVILAKLSGGRIVRNTKPMNPFSLKGTRRMRSSTSRAAR